MRSRTRLWQLAMACAESICDGALAHKPMRWTATAFALQKLLKRQAKQVICLAIALPRPPLEGSFHFAGESATATITNLEAGGRGEFEILQQPLYSS
jgi:hypothetical protein